MHACRTVPICYLFNDAISSLDDVYAGVCVFCVCVCACVRSND